MRSDVPASDLTREIMADAHQALANCSLPYVRRPEGQS